MPNKKTFDNLPSKNDIYSDKTHYFIKKLSLIEWLCNVLVHADLNTFVFLTNQ